VSRRRIAALAAVIVVPVALLAIVLASLLQDDDSTKQPVRTATSPAKGPTGTGPTSSPAPTTTSPQTGGSTIPDQPLGVLDQGATPKKVSEKLGPASKDGTIALSELRGAPIVLNVWSADCTPCQAETRVLQSEWERLGARGVVFLGLNVLDSSADARRFREKNGVTYPSVQEKRATTARTLGATGVPETFFVSKDGEVVGHVIGEVSLAQIELGVRAAQNGQPMPTDQGGGRVPFP
jgi:peroxiredoxin